MMTAVTIKRQHGFIYVLINHTVFFATRVLGYSFYKFALLSIVQWDLMRIKTYLFPPPLLLSTPLALVCLSITHWHKALRHTGYI